MWQCRNCGMAFIWPQPSWEAIKELYSQDYFCNPESASAGYDNYHEDKKLILKTFDKRLNKIEKLYPQKGRLLDLGCAMGFFLEVASGHGWEIYGVDVSKMAADVAGQEFGDRIFNDILENLDFPDNYFDVITAWDYLEHVTEPQEIVSICRRILKPGGLLVLTTPDLSSRVAQLAQDSWMGYKEDHLFYFTRKSLSIILQKKSFIVEPMQSAGKYIMAKWFIKRLGIYSPLTSKILAKTFKFLRLPDFSIYINPLDIVMVLAKK